MVANGTGIAPFLGMLSEGRKSSIHLTWGGRNEQSVELYRDYLETPKSSKGKNLFTCELALSREEPKRYVQDALAERRSEVARILEKGGIFMLCGSIHMQQGVIETLNEITRSELDTPLSEFQLNGQLLMDCY